MPTRILATLRLVLAVALCCATAATSLAQAQPPPAAPLAIKGDLRIACTRTQTDGGKPRAGSADTYTLNVNVANSAVFKGTITHRPFMTNTLSKNQPGSVGYELDLDVVNPANPAQTRNVGKVFGSAPIDDRNVYRFTDGSVKVAVFGMGAAKGFESRFSGLALGKPPAGSALSRAKQDAVKLFSGKGGSITLSKYDKMELQQHVLAAGPVAIYPESTVSGTLFFDYGRSAWHFNNVSITYAQDGRRMLDTLTGNIRWIEHPNRKANGEGRYEFDIRVNEPLPTEGAVFAAAADEASFFATDDVTPSLTGSMAYKDTISSGGVVVASAVTIDLKGNRLTKQQVMALGKLLLLSCVVPLNAE